MLGDKQGLEREAAAPAAPATNLHRRRALAGDSGGVLGHASIEIDEDVHLVPIDSRSHTLCVGCAHLMHAAPRRRLSEVYGGMPGAEGRAP